MLAHVAFREGIVAVENIAGKDTLMDYKVVPDCVFSMPEVASVGSPKRKPEKKIIILKSPNSPLWLMVRPLVWERLKEW